MLIFSKGPWTVWLVGDRWYVVTRLEEPFRPLGALNYPDDKPELVLVDQRCGDVRKTRGACIWFPKHRSGPGGALVVRGEVEDESGKHRDSRL